MAGFPLLSWPLLLPWPPFSYPLVLPYEEMADKGGQYYLEVRTARDPCQVYVGVVRSMNYVGLGA